MKIILESRHSNITKGGEKTMRHLRIFLAFGVIVFVLGTLITSWAAENVRNSKHNLAVNPNIGAEGTTEVCVFCHTPHGGSTDVGGGAAPLWNRNMADMTPSSGFTPYQSPNFDSQGDTPGKPKGVSLACLSCHDGSLAFDALLNFGGSGSTDNVTGFNPTSSTPKVDTTTGRMINVGSQQFPMLGTDLSNDHPISMAIPCGKDPQFDSTVSGSTEKQICDNKDSAELAAGRISPLYRGNSNTVLHADKRNWVRAYPRWTGTGWDATPYIECASCHNPHEENNAVGNTLLAGFTGPARDTRFLRYPSFVNTAEETAVGGPSVLDVDRNAGSLLCLSCHQK